MGSKLVSVAIITYNHEHYIKECIESIVAQIVDFDYEIVIGQDCSTDATHAVCLHYAQLYPDLIRYTQRTRNLGMMGNWMATIKECTGKYIALCEGDDYWTDPYKLQKQVDFLEANQDYSICWTKYLVKNESSSNAALLEPEWINQVERDKNLSFDLNTIFTPYCTYTLTSMFRVQSFDIKLFESLQHSKDNSLYAIVLTQGKGMLLNFYSAVYRMHDGGIYSSASEFKQRYFSYLNINEIIQKVAGCNTANLRTIRDGLLRMSFRHCPSQKSKVYFNLVLESYKIFGWRTTLGYVLKKYKGEPI